MRHTSTIPAGLTDDPADARLVAHVRPHGRTQRVPSGRHNLVVIGGGAAGLVSAMGAADQLNRTRLTPFIARALRRILKWRR